MNMIDQAKEKREELEEAIGKLVRAFEKETCLSLTAITAAGVFEGEFTDVKIEVELPRGMSEEYNKEREKEWERKRDKG